MPLFLWFYLGGLTLALAVGFVFYCAVGGQSVALFSALFGEQSGRLWGRAFRMTLVTIAVIGGLSSKWYGCGYTDYQKVANDHRVMLEKTSEQVSGALGYSTYFLILTAVLGAIVYAIVRPRRRPDPIGRSQAIRRE